MGHEKWTCNNSQTIVLCKYRARKIHLGYFVFIASRTALLSIFLPKEFLLLLHPQEGQPGQHHNTGFYRGLTAHPQTCISSTTQTHLGRAHFGPTSPARPYCHLAQALFTLFPCSLYKIGIADFVPSATTSHLFA